MTIDVSLVSAELGLSPDINGHLPSPAPSADAGKLHILAHSPSGKKFTLLFDSMIKPDLSASRWGLATPPVKYTYDPNAPQVSIDRSANVNVRWRDGSFQELGLTSSPTAFNYANDPTSGATPHAAINTDKIEFTLHVTTGTVTDQLVPVTLDHQMLGSADDDTDGTPDGDEPFKTPDSMAVALQEAIDAALVAYGFSAGDVVVCRINPDVNAGSPGSCSGLGNTLVLQGKTGTVTGLSLDIPKMIDTGDGQTATLNGAITELGFNPGVGELHQSRASKFFLDNVDLTGRFEIIVPDATASAHFSFLAITADGSGTLPGGAVDTGNDGRLVNLALTVKLKNPIAEGNLIVGTTVTNGNADPSNLQAEVQDYKVPTSQDFTLFMPTVDGGQRTDTVSGTASDPNAAVKAALEALKAIGSGNVTSVTHTTVSPTTGDTHTYNLFEVTFSSSK